MRTRRRNTRAQLIARIRACRARVVSRRRLRLSAARADLLAVAHERLVEHQETDWDFAEDCLVTHGPAGVVNTVTGVCGLASMVWLYGVAWQQPMAEAVAWTNAAVAVALPTTTTLKGDISNASDRVERLLPALPTLPAASTLLHFPGSARIGTQADSSHGIWIAGQPRPIKARATPNSAR